MKPLFNLLMATRVIYSLNNRATVIVLVITLAATTICRAQIQEPPKPNVNEQLIGSWGYFGDKSQPGVYIFNQDGSFVYYTAVRNNYLRTGSLYAMEAIYKGSYQTEGNRILFSHVSMAKFDRSKDNANRNLIGDITHAKKMLGTTTGFSPWTLEPMEFNFIEPGVVRIAKKDNKDEIRTIYRADWGEDAAPPPGEAATDKSANSFQLKIYHGFDFPNKRVVKYGSNSRLTDLRFYQQTQRTGIFAYLGAAKIREFDNPPTGLSAAQVAGWNDYSFSPKTGAYYVIRSRDGRHYLLHLKNLTTRPKQQATGCWS